MSIWIFGYQALNGGLINYFTLGIMIFAIFIEENLGKSVWWKVLYVTFLLIELIKVICFKSQDPRNYAYSEFFLGRLEPSMSIILPIMVLIENLKKKGFSSKTLS